MSINVYHVNELFAMLFNKRYFVEIRELVVEDLLFIANVT